MLIDRYVPLFDAVEEHEIEVDAPPAVAYAAIRKADIRDPIVGALFAIRELPGRIARRLRHEPAPVAPPVVTFADLSTPENGFMPLAEEPGSEFVVGAVGRFWKRDYGWRAVAPEHFVEFREPGFAKLAVSFAVRPVGIDRAIVHYEARTATTDAVAHRHFRRYWTLIRPGVAIVMRRALERIKAEAEREQQALAPV